MKSLLIWMFAFMFAFNLEAADQIQDQGTGESFPAEISFDYQGKNYQLEATGTATRKKLLFKVYSVAHYLQKGAAGGNDKLKTIMNDANAKQLTLKWLRDVPADKVHGGYVESLKAAIPEPAASRLQSEINTYLGLFNQDVHKGDVHVIRWIPGGIIEVQINGKTVGTISHPDFARGVWNIWFGPNSVVNKDNLISQMK